MLTEEPMLAEEKLRNGELEESLSQLKAQVRKDPANAKYRTFLFQLLAVMGQWERAMTQLNVAGELDAGTLAMVQTYREALRCEVLRAEIFAGKRTPLVFGKPHAWMALLLEAQRLVAEGAFEQAAEVRAKALEDAPATPGEVDGTPFEWISDGDTRLGPVLEVIVNGRYYWVPFDRIAEVQLDKPEDLRDLVWMPAHLTWANGGQTVALIPNRYPGSESAADVDLVRARKTEWVEHPGETFVGLGQRMLFTDQGEYALMDLRHLILRPTTDEADAGVEAGDPVA